jgi:hypothetical protein
MTHSRREFSGWTQALRAAAVVDLAGVCVPRPQACVEIYDPVYGCDRATYANDCARVSAGATLAHAGACAGLGP